jgi:hypothetical protein
MPRTPCVVFCWLLVALVTTLPAVQGVAEFAAVLKPDHESFAWRRLANRTEPTFDKTYHWIRHEQIGIGNTLGGYVTSMFSALREDRLLVMTSRILFKFCDVVKCSIDLLKAPYVKKVGANVTLGSSYFFKVGYAANELNGLTSFVNAIGCAQPPSVLEQQPVSNKKQLPPLDKDWPKRCLYSKLIRSLVESENGMLQKKKEWLRSFFVGDRGRFDMVVSVDKEDPLPVYDYVVHLRTISLIEVSLIAARESIQFLPSPFNFQFVLVLLLQLQDMSTADGLPANLKEKADAFVTSEAFENMVQCFAAEITKGGVLNLEKTRAVMKTGSSPSLAWRNTNRTINIYVTTDCAQVRAEFAERIKKAVVARLAFAIHKVTKRRRLSSSSTPVDGRLSRRLAPPPSNMSDWKVSVDYFNGDLPPAHFFVWTAPNKEMKEVRRIFLTPPQS